VTKRFNHACCAVRGALVVLGGETVGGDVTSSVEILSSSQEGGAFVELPPLRVEVDEDDDDESEDDVESEDDDESESRGGIDGAAAIAVDESDSAAGQVLLLGGGDANGPVSTVQLVDLATGACAPQNNLLRPRYLAAAGRLPDGRVVCAGGFGSSCGSAAEVWGPPEQGSADPAWIWRELPAMSVPLVPRYACCGCVMSDGRFAVLGGRSNGVPTSSCEALVVDDGGEHWVPLPPMHDTRIGCTCGAVAECVIVAGGVGRISAELYDEELNRWLRLPCDLPYEGGLSGVGSAVL
jgi:hypothetical protein